MQNRTMLSFHKDRDCPSSQELLAFQTGKAPKSSSAKIGDHICSCDFCGAEAEFYSHFPQTPEAKVSVAEIPVHLFQLAEAILNNKHKGSTLLKKLISENEQFAL